MFDFIRTHTRLFLGVVVLLIIPSFVFFGVQGYSGFGGDVNSKVAQVDGQAITRVEWDTAQQRTVERMRQQMPGVDVRLLDTPEMRRETLDGLVRERVLLSAADKMHLGVSDERLQRVFATDPQFAALRNPDGSVNRDLLIAQGMSSEMFAQRLRQDLAMRQVLQGIGGTTLAPKTLVDQSLDAAAAAAPGAAAAFRRRRLPQQGQSERCRYRGLLQGQRSALQGARAGADRIPGARRPGPAAGGVGAGRGPAPLLHGKRGALHRGRGASRQPHPDRCRQGQAGRRAPASQGQGRDAAGTVAQDPGPVRRVGQGPQQRPGQRRARRRPGLLRPRRDGQALRRRRLRDEAGRDQQRRGERFRLSHHPADGAARRREEELRRGARRDRERGAPAAGAKALRRSGRAVHQHRVRAGRQPAAHRRQAQA